MPLRFSWPDGRRDWKESVIASAADVAVANRRRWCRHRRRGAWPGVAEVPHGAKRPAVAATAKALRLLAASF